MKKRVALYVRVSTEEQKKGLSVDAQIMALQDYSKEHDYDVFKVYNDAGISARKSYKKRPALLEMIKDCQDGKIDLILICKLDRFFRSVKDYYSVMEQLNDIPWKTIHEDYSTDNNDANGMLMLNLYLAVAQSEADRTSDRIVRTFEYKRAKGDYVGSAPYGYKRSNNRLVKDESCSSIVDAIFETYLKTHSSLQAMRKAHDMGSTITKRGVLCILRNETYTGNAKGTKCEPYITKEQFEIIKDVKESNHNTRAPKGIERTYIFQSICVCKECGRILRANAARRNGLEFNSYACTGNNLIDHKGFSLSEKKIEKYLLDNIDAIIDDYNIKAQEIKQNDIQMQELEKKEKSLKQKLDRIGIRFELGDYSVEEYKEKRREIQREIDNLPKIESAAQPVSLPNDWRAIYNELDAQHKQEFWFSIIKNIEISLQKEISIFFY